MSQAAGNPRASESGGSRPASQRGRYTSLPSSEVPKPQFPEQRSAPRMLLMLFWEPWRWSAGKKASSLRVVAGLARGSLGNSPVCGSMGRSEAQGLAGSVSCWKKGGIVPSSPKPTSPSVCCSWGPSRLPAPRVGWGPEVPTARGQDLALSSEALVSALLLDTTNLELMIIPHSNRA